MMAHIIADPIAAIVQGGKRITAVSNVLSRMTQCITIKPAVTLPICNNSRVERIASACGFWPNMQPCIRLAIVKSDVRKNTHAMHTADQESSPPAERTEHVFAHSFV